MDIIEEARDRAAASGNPGDLLGAMDAVNVEMAGSDAFDAYNGAQNAASIANINDYVNALQNVAANSQNFNLTPAEVTNPYVATSMQQAGMDANSNYARMLQELAGGANNVGVTNTAYNPNANVSSLAQVLKALYGA